MPGKAKWTRKGLKATLALMEADRAEDARRLARYDEAIRLLQLAKFDEAHWHEADAFLATEPKEGEGAR